MKVLLLTLLLCSTSFAKEVPSYQAAILQSFHVQAAGMNCYSAGASTNCGNAMVPAYTVKMGGTVYTLTPYGTWPHHESLWKVDPGVAVEAWKDGKRIHVRVGEKDSRYDIVGASTE